MKRSTWITWAIVALIGISTIGNASNREGSDSFNAAALVIDLAVVAGVVWAISALVQWIYGKVTPSTERR
jgi:drug/metabolite transporter (DMT)-like permease